MYETNSANQKQIISNYFVQDDNRSLYSLINNLKASSNNVKNIDIIMDSISNISKENSMSSKLSTVSNSNINELMKKRKRNENSKITKKDKLINNFEVICDNSGKIKRNDKNKPNIDKQSKSIKRNTNEIIENNKMNRDMNNTFDEIFKYKQNYIDDERFLNKKDFIRTKNDYNIFSQDNIFSLNQISQNQMHINKKTRENKSILNGLLSKSSSVSSIISRNYNDHNINQQRIKIFNLDFNNKLSLRDKKN